MAGVLPPPGAVPCGVNESDVGSSYQESGNNIAGPVHTQVHPRKADRQYQRQQQCRGSPPQTRRECSGISTDTRSASLPRRKRRQKTACPLGKPYTDSTARASAVSGLGRATSSFSPRLTTGASVATARKMASAQRLRSNAPATADSGIHGTAIAQLMPPIPIADATRAAWSSHPDLSSCNSRSARLSPGNVSNTRPNASRTATTNRSRTAGISQVTQGRVEGIERYLTTRQG